MFSLHSECSQDDTELVSEECGEQASTRARVRCLARTRMGYNLIITIILFTTRSAPLTRHETWHARTVAGEFTKSLRR